MKGLTRRQQEVLGFIEEWIRDKRYPPSVREIAQRFGLRSASGVHKHVKALVRKQFITKDDFLSRSIRIVERSTGGTPATSGETVPVPVTLVLGANGTLLTIETPPVPLTVSGRMVPEPRGVFAVQIGGHHLHQEGLLGGDYAIVMPHQAVRNGAVVLASVRAQEALIRRFHRDGDQVQLSALAPDLPPFQLLARDVHVQGVVAGIWRPFP